MRNIEDLKFAIIYGQSIVDGEIKDGFLEKIPKDDVDTYHYLYAKEFLENHILENAEYLKKLTNANSIFFEIQNLGHIVFVENTYNSNHPSGLFYMPKNCSKNQKKALLDFKNDLESNNYNITVLYNLVRSEEGVIDGRQKVGPASILDEFCIDSPEIYDSGDER